MIEECIDTKDGAKIWFISSECFLFYCQRLSDSLLIVPEIGLMLDITESIFTYVKVIYNLLSSEMTS